MRENRIEIIINFNLRRLHPPNCKYWCLFVHYAAVDSVIDSTQHRMDAHLPHGYIPYLLQMSHPAELFLIADLDRRIINQFDLRMCEIKKLGLIPNPISKLIFTKILLAPDEKE